MEVDAKIDETQHADGDGAVHNEDDVASLTEVPYDPFDDSVSNFCCGDAEHKSTPAQSR